MSTSIARSDSDFYVSTNYAFLAVFIQLIGSILTGDYGIEGYGSDLIEHEVKSAAIGSSFEYQYHLNAGLKQLREDKVVQHIFISYSTDYQDVLVRMIPGYELAEIFSSWEPLLEENYRGLFRRQRFRRSIAYGMVVTKGLIVMEIRSGKLVSANDIEPSSAI